MYAVVGCGECSNLWIVEGRSETSECPRCGTRRAFEKRKQFVETDDADHAREVRASMLAARQGQSDVFADVDSVSELEDQVEDGVIDDEAYLEGSGLDADEIAAAGDRDPRSPSGSSRKDVVERALSELDEPTESEIVEYADDHGVPADYVETALEKLRRRGEVSESGGRYRRL
ncbi:DUF5817 domain-containing protein [Saliphagus sp. LR7]|uniref:DUF5817 domain-containing protein n=1 Tax=Saliphagus sp. LR7 TaxID=2282654 RepID=UPI000DF767DA|nr:DUF5817 domain-containing protein [Saliphagus sp. LR7]